MLNQSTFSNTSSNVTFQTLNLSTNQTINHANSTPNKTKGRTAMGVLVPPAQMQVYD